MDERLLLAINGMRSPALDPVVGFVAEWGLFAFLIALIALGGWRRDARALASMRDGWLAFFVALFASDTVLKPLIARPRPTAVAALASQLHVLGRVPPPTSTSFPSGTAAACAACAAWIWMRFGSRAGIVAAIYAVLVSLSRLYIGVHWPTDLVAGAVVGVAVAIGIDRLDRRIGREVSRRSSL
jgi:undecaprenyl-diphosphatase